MTRRQAETKAHVQKSSCFIVGGRTELCLVQGISKQQSLKSRATGGASQRKMNTLVPEHSSGLQNVSERPRVHSSQIAALQTDLHTLSNTSVCMDSYACPLKQ